MATVELTIAGRRHELACRNGEEDHLRTLARMVEAKANDAARSMGGMSEARQMLFAALLLADELNDARAAAARLAAAPPLPDPAIAATIEALAERLEMLSDRLNPPQNAAGDQDSDGDGVETSADAT